ncbi:unnamed protein product, partial [Oppiella nova]
IKSSVLNFHNESGNIFTHLIGSLLFAFLWYRSMSGNIYQNFGLIDKLIFGAFFFGIIICLLISTLFHTFRCHSRRVLKLFAKLDYCGITLLIAASFVPWIYYGFYYLPTQRNLYLSSTVLLCMACFVISLFEKFSEPELRKIRSCIFLLNGCSAAQLAFKSILMLILMGTLYIIGALCYMYKIPECLCPGRFDLWFNSHQIFHTLVIVAGLTYFHSILPDWYGHNDFITNGYRPVNKSYKQCLKSMFYLHNESGNIYTHAVGFLLFCTLFIHTMSCNEYKNFEANDKFMFSLFFTATLTCQAMSAMFHTFQCHSRETFKLFAKLDYCGITLLITSSNIPWVYYGFYDTVLPKIIYISLTLVLGTGGIIISLMDRFSNPEYIVIRGAVFILIGLCGIAPFIHFCRHIQINDPIPAQLAFKGIFLLPIMGALYITGAVLYMIKIPERLAPGLFNIWFQSHQLFHIASVGAGLVYYHSLSLIAEVRLNYSESTANSIKV